MQKFATSLILTLTLATSVHAHAGAHAAFSALEVLRHFFSEPFHIGLTAAAVCLLAVTLRKHRKHRKARGR